MCMVMGFSIIRTMLSGAVIRHRIAHREIIIMRVLTIRFSVPALALRMVLMWLCFEV